MCREEPRDRLTLEKVTDRIITVVHKALVGVMLQSVDSPGRKFRSTGVLYNRIKTYKVLLEVTLSIWVKLVEVTLSILGKNYSRRHFDV